MEAAIISALITGGLSLAGVIISNVMSNRKIEHKLEISQAISNTKLEGLTEEVRRHNNFAEKIPSMQTEINTLKRDVDQLKKFHLTPN